VVGVDDGSHAIQQLVLGTYIQQRGELIHCTESLQRKHPSLHRDTYSPIQHVLHCRRRKHTQGASVVVVRHQREVFESIAKQNNEGYEYRLFDLLWAINSQWYFAIISTSRFFALHPHTQLLPNTITASPQHPAPQFLSPTKLQPKPCFTSCLHLTYVHPQSTQSPPPNFQAYISDKSTSRYPPTPIVVPAIQILTRLPSYKILTGAYVHVVLADLLHRVNVGRSSAF
jgi:hypothetical protein